MTLRDEILATRSPWQVPLLPLPTPEWPGVDGKLFIRTLSERDYIDCFDGDDNEDEAVNRSKFACRVLCDASGNRVLQDEDAAALAAKETPVIERIYWAGREHNGLTEANRRVLRKNSSGTGGSGLPTSSPAPSTPDSGSTSSGS